MYFFEEQMAFLWLCSLQYYSQQLGIELLFFLHLNLSLCLLKKEASENVWISSAQKNELTLQKIAKITRQYI